MIDEIKFEVSKLGLSVVGAAVGGRLDEVVGFGIPTFEIGGLDTTIGGRVEGLLAGADVNDVVLGSGLVADLLRGQNWALLLAAVHTPFMASPHPTLVLSMI